MTTLQYHTDLYALEAIEGSAEVFRDFAQIDVAVDSQYVQVVVQPHEAESEAELIGELSNQILGRSIELYSSTKDTQL